MDVSYWSQVFFSAGLDNNERDGIAEQREANDYDLPISKVGGRTGKI